MFKKILTLLILGVFFSGVTRLSLAMMCGEHRGQKQMAQTHSEAEHGVMSDTARGAHPKEAVNAGNKICPVSDEEIEEKTKSTYEYEGKIYNFCCPMCIASFNKDPKKYLKKVDQELKEGVSKKAEGAGKIAPGHLESEETGHGHHH